MSRSSLRRIRRLRTEAAPVIAERDRRLRELKNTFRSLAEDHLLRVILVFRYGEPRIEEPLALAYRRALSNLKIDERSSLHHLRAVLEREPPAGDIKSKISTWVRQMPDWLRFFCKTDLSMKLLGLEIPPLPDDIKIKFFRTKSDRDAWPLLPQGILKPPPPGFAEQFRIMKDMSLEDQMYYIKIIKKPEQEWTRREYRFIREWEEF